MRSVTPVAESDILYAANGLPALQNRMFDTREAALASATGDVRLAQDPVSGLVRNIAFDPAIIVYDADYQNEQGLSPSFEAHLRETADRLEPLMRGRRIIEIGCGKGRFLRMLAERGHDVEGIDPAYEGDDPRIAKRRFTGSDRFGADLIVLRHVLEHIPDPAGFMACIAQANGGTAKIYIEVPCLEWIASNKAWYDIFYEHVNYFTKEYFESLFGQIYEMRHCFGGQYIGVTAELSSLRPPRLRRALRLPDDFSQSLDRWTRVPVAQPFAVWGAASKGVIFSLLMARAGRSPAAIIDINPAKQGRHVAGAGLLVSAPEDALAALPSGAAILVANPNYHAEIAAAVGGRFSVTSL
ncbi:class I SAM-dependent methyltransferase [Rubrimonas cliftonensis]|uniref:Methyltransferase domain-containing protein n=1 Tax=Rubrimonas cliftonensis TaxID=89524 RepID=A0A1H4G734_9RHOB|nr:class I SAM-dependent methyltransferase [Rubrimonas cliftonensis]SEB05364.1 Methyltransferase domain-containing protein [Rubrimonas cliftonensis]